MEHAILKTLLVLTLLQLCRAEISQILPGQWFSANAINDDFSPKPISELFSSSQSPPAQSSTSFVTQPVIVTQSSPQNSVTQSTPQFTVTQSPPTLTVKQTQPSFSVTQPIVVLSPSSTPQPTYPSSNQPGTTLFQTISTSKAPEFSSTPLPTFGEIDLSSVNFTPSTTQTPTFFDSGLTFTPPTVRIVPPASTQFSTFASEFPSTTSTPPPNFVVVYQAPQNTRPTEVPPPVPTVSTPQVTSTTISTLPSTTITPAVISTTTTSPFTSPANICRTSPIVTPTILTSTLAPNTLSNRPISTKSPGLIIRVVAPKGSITNVKINPTTSTQRPRTKRTSKPKRNSYDACIQSCRGRKDILCSIPLSSTIIDPKELKSFPSICHMACHNSYRTPAYEKITDGRCSRLRTRIVTVGSTTKLRRDELKKSEYSIVNAGQQGTVVEFSNGSI